MGSIIRTSTSGLTPVDGGILVVPKGGSHDDSANIQKALDTIAATGRIGKVKLVGDSYNCEFDIQQASGAQIVGEGFQLDVGTASIESGTRLLSTGAQIGIGINTTPTATQPSITEVYARIAYGNQIKNIAFDGFARGIQIGANKTPGVFYGIVKNVASINFTDWGFWFENFGFYTQLRQYYAQWGAPGSNGCIMHAASNTNYNYANSRMDTLFASPSDLPGKNLRNIVFMAYEGSSFNDLTITHAQCNMNKLAGGVSSTTQAATMTSGSTSIGIVDSSLFPVDVPVHVSTNANGFYSDTTYFVLTSAANVITLAKYQGGTPISATGAAAVSVTNGGYPGIEFIGYGDVSAFPAFITGATILGVDIEGNATAAVVGQNSTLNFSISTGGGYILGKNWVGTLSALYPQTIEFDAYSFCQVSASTSQENGARQIGVRRVDGQAQLFMGSANFSFKSYSYNQWDNILLGAPLLNRTRLWSTSTTLSSAKGPNITYNGATAATFALPQITRNAQGPNSNVGLSFMVHNGASAAVALTLAADATNPDTFDGDATKTSYSIPQYGTITVTALYDAANSLSYWIVNANNGAT